MQVLKSHGQEHLIERLTKNLGFGMGLEYKESSNLLTGKNEGVIKSGMIFNVCIGVQGLENPEATDPKKKVRAGLMHRGGWGGSRVQEGLMLRGGDTERQGQMDVFWQ